MNAGVALFCLCTVAVYTTAERTVKAKRDVSGLFPFPRVGRMDPSLGSRYSEMKRQGLIPFPRVGRSGKGNGNEKRGEFAENGGGGGSGLWFGPRLARLQKRNFRNEEDGNGDEDGDWVLVRIKDLPFTTNKKEFLERLGKGIPEEADQSKDYHN